MPKYFKLKEDLEMDNDYFGKRSGGGIAKSGTVFELIREPTPQKKKYKLMPCDVKFPYYLYLRKNDFNRLFEEINVW